MESKNSKIKTSKSKQTKTNKKPIAIFLGLFMFVLLAFFMEATLQVVTVTIDSRAVTKLLEHDFTNNEINLLTKELSSVDKRILRKIVFTLKSGTIEEREGVKIAIKDYLQTITSEETLEINEKKLGNIQKSDLELNEILESLYE